MNKFTKITLASAIACVFSAQANAGAYTPQPTIPVQEEPFFNGFYIGVGAGVVGINGDVTTHNTIGEWPFEASFSRNYSYPDTSDITAEGSLTIENFSHLHKGDNIGKYGFGAAIFAGFGQVMNSSYYLGAELFANYFSPDMKHSFERSLDVSFDDTIEFTYENDEGTATAFYTTTTKVKNKYSYGGDVRLGYLISPKTMFYVLFGLDYAKFKVESMSSLPLIAINGYSPPVPINGMAITNNFSKSKFGYIPGVGLETVLNNNDNFTLRAEYRHAFYPSFEKTVYGELREEPVRGITPGDDVHSLITKVKPSRGVFSLNLSYYLK
jgi:hypothetical protein